MSFPWKHLGQRRARPVQGVERVWLSSKPPASSSGSGAADSGEPCTPVGAAADGNRLSQSPLPEHPPSDLAAVEMPWWVYTAAGMHLLFPSSLPTLSGSSLFAPQFTPETAQLEQELQFDAEVFPIGVSLADAAVLGVTQRLHRAPHAPLAASQVRPTHLLLDFRGCKTCGHPADENLNEMPSLRGALATSHRCSPRDSLINCPCHPLYVPS